MSKICPCCKTRNKDNVEFCVKCKNPLDLTDYIESKKLDLKFGSKLKSSFGMESKEDKVNLEIEKFIKLYQKFIGFDKDLNDLKSKSIDDRVEKQFKNKYQCIDGLKSFNYLDEIKQDSDLNNNLIELNSIEERFNNLKSFISDVNEFFSNIEAIKSFNGDFDDLKNSDTIISSAQVKSLKDDYDGLYGFFNFPKEKFKELFDFNDYEIIGNFLNDYSNIDRIVKEINEPIEISEFENRINNQIKGLNDLKDSKTFIESTQETLLKNKYKKFYEEIQSFKKQYDLNLSPLILAFLKDCENIETIITNINGSFMTRKLKDNPPILDEILDLKNSNNKITVSNKIQIKDKYNDYFKFFNTYDTLKLDSEDKKIVNKFLTDYEKLDSIIEEVNKGIEKEAMEVKINNQVNEVNNFNNELNDLKDSKTFIKSTQETLLKNKYKKFYEEIQSFKKQYNLNLNPLILTFLKDYENISAIVENINEKFMLSKIKDNPHIFDDIFNLKTAREKITESNKIQIKDKYNDYFKFFNNYDTLKLDSEDKKIVNKFLSDYKNMDSIVKKVNKSIEKKELKIKIKNYSSEVDNFNKELNDLKISTTPIRNNQKKDIKRNYLTIVTDIQLAKNEYKIKLSKDLKKFFNDYKNLDTIINEINETIKTRNLREKFNTEILEASLFNMEFNDLINLKVYPDYLKIENFKNNYKDLYNTLNNQKNVNDLNIINEFKNFFQNYKRLNMNFRSLKDSYIEKELKENEEFFNDIDGKSLDNLQRKAVVVDEVNTEVIAGAGSGKSLTISGKVKYLIEKKNISPQNILCISYSKASVSDLNKKLPDDVNAFTFHKLGKTILKDNGEVSNPDESALNNFIKHYFTRSVIKNPKLCEYILKFFGYYYYNPISEDEVSSLGELYDMEKGRDFNTLRSIYGGDNTKITMGNEEVKSLEELVIANFLFINGIEYEYEKEYITINKEYEIYKEYLKEFLFPNPINDSIPDSIQENTVLKIMDYIPIKGKIVYDYKPDFYLPESEIYLEHFGVNRNCHALWLTKEECKKYLEGIIWKRKFHKKHGTKLLETYSYYMQENRLLSRLKEKLINENVEFHEINYQALFSKLIERDDVYKFKNFMKLITNFIELFKGNNYKKDKFQEFRQINKQDSDNFNKVRNELFLNIVEDAYSSYEDFLKEKNKIDFNDMINNATALVNQSKFNDHYDYIIIDEYQDTSHTRYDLVKAIQNQINCKVCVVGDDWQSIYRFSGCDVSLFTNFEDYFENPEILYIENTYRNSQQLIDITAKFVKKNTNQSQKTLKSSKSLTKPVKIAYYNKMSKISKIKVFEYLVNKSSEISNNILILGRNNFDIDSIIEVDGSPFTKKGKEKELKIIYKKNPDLNIQYRTVHSSKGLEEDNVILLNLENKMSGFPNQIIDDPVLKFVINNTDQYEYAEERRLFYVALTRTKNNTYLLVPETDKSIFVKELEEDEDKLEIIDKKLIDEFLNETGENLNQIMKNATFYSIPTKLKCPHCKTGTIILKVINKNGKQFKFLDCSQERCTWDGGFYNSEIDLIDEIEFCPKCGGTLQVKKGKYGYFKGCNNYPKCRNIKKLNSKETERINEKLNINPKETEEKQEKPMVEQIETPLKCPKCGKGKVTLISSHIKGKDIKFFKCSQDDCDWDGGFYNQDNKYLKDIELCPSCDGVMYPKNSRNGLFMSCSKFPKCRQSHDMKTETTTPKTESRNIKKPVARTTPKSEPKKSIKPIKKTTPKSEPKKSNDQIETSLTCPKCGEGKVTLFSSHKNGKEYKFFKCSDDDCDWDGGFYNQDNKYLKDIELCPSCDGVMYPKNSQNGLLMSCSKFPKCRQSHPMKTETTHIKSNVHQVNTKLRCPQCGEGKVKLITTHKNGKEYKFFRCSNNDCNWNGGFYNQDNKYLKDIEHCPSCDGIMYPKNSKRGLFMSCSNFPRCKESHTYKK